MKNTASNVVGPLLTDFYQLTMAYAFWKHGRHEELSAYDLFFRKNPRGLHHEQWFHAVGCRKFFNVTRDTVSYEILETYKPGQQPVVTAESRNGSASDKGAAK